MAIVEAFVLPYLMPLIISAVAVWIGKEIVKVVAVAHTYLVSKEGGAHGAAFSLLDKAMEALVPVADQAVQMTKQTFVDEAKKSGKFDAAAAEKALMTSISNFKTLAPQAQAALIGAGVTDAEAVIKILIEAAVSRSA